MLVLSRKPGEKVYIGSGVTFVVLKVQGKRVRIGIEAPANVPVVREELCRRPAGPCHGGTPHYKRDASCG